MGELDRNTADGTPEGTSAKHRAATPAGPALPIAALALCVAGAAVGYFASWPVGAALVIASIACAILAIRKRAALRWLAILALALDIACIVAVGAVIAMLLNQINQMNELMGTIS